MTEQTPQQFVAWLTPHFKDYGGVKVENAEDSLFHRPVVRVSIVTGGWSEHEEWITWLERTMFSLVYWQSSHRGGLHVYEVPESHWTSMNAEMIGPIAGEQPS